jgi:hypothetical protein
MSFFSKMSKELGTLLDDKKDKKPAATPERGKLCASLSFSSH